MKKILISLGSVILIAVIVFLFVNARSVSKSKSASCCKQGTEQTKTCPMQGSGTPCCPEMAGSKK